MKFVAVLLGLGLSVLAEAGQLSSRGLRVSGVPAVATRVSVAPVVAVAAKSEHEATPAVAVAVPVLPVATMHVDAAATMETSMELAIQAMSMNLMSFLGDPAPKWPEFRFWQPRCLDHTRRIIRRVDLSYTDLSLRALLLDQCHMDRNFQSSYEDGFDDDQACRDFADNLVVARDLEQEGKGLAGYELFCKRYYDHKSNRPREAPATTTAKAIEEVKEVEKEEESYFEGYVPHLENVMAWFKKYFPWIVVCLIIVVLVVLLVGRRRSQAAAAI